MSLNAYVLSYSGLKCKMLAITLSVIGSCYQITLGSFQGRWSIFRLIAVIKCLREDVWGGWWWDYTLLKNICKTRIWCWETWMRIFWFYRLRIPYFWLYCHRFLYGEVNLRRGKPKSRKMEHGYKLLDFTHFISISTFVAPFKREVSFRRMRMNNMSGK